MIKDQLRRFPPAVTCGRKARAAKAALSEATVRIAHKTDMAVLDGIPTFVPGSAGSRKGLAHLGLRSAERTFPRLADLIGHDRLLAEPVPIASFADSDDTRAAAEKLRLLFDQYGSDKATSHYHLFYGPILAARTVAAMLEVGLGTNNTDVVSHMGPGGRPGASLRAFRDFLPGAALYGADIDRGILFQEDRIRTFFVDQTDPGTFGGLAVPAGLDLVIDDGLHTPDANIATLTFGLGRVRVGGWVVVEDIPHRVLPVWQVVAALLPDRFESHIVAGRWDLLFAVQRVR